MPPDYQDQYYTDDTVIKQPPHSLEAEQSVLGGILLDNNTWENIVDIIATSDFYNPNNRIIFTAIERLVVNKQPIDGVTLIEELNLQQELDGIGGLQYIAQLADATPSISNIEFYATIIRERSILRQLITVSREIGNMAYFPEEQSVAEVLDIAEAKVFEIADQSAKSRVVWNDMPTLTKAVTKQLEKMATSDGYLTGYSTGFDKLDEKTAGLQDSDLIIIAGRPSMGKTTFAMNLVENVALTAKKPVAVFSMEMPANQLLARMLSSLSRVNGNKIRTGQGLTNEDWSNITSNVALLNTAPIFIDDSPALSPPELRARVRRLKREQGDLAMIVVDYIQLMRSGQKVENRATEISEISRNLKALAKEMNVPVIALSQLNRSLESRSDRRPIMSDLRESGAIEQDADVIICLYREEVYNNDTPDKSIAEAIIRKQRNGPTGTIKLRFFGEFTRFENLAPEYYETAEL